MDVFNNEIAQSSFLAKFKVSFSRKKSPEFQKQKNVKNKHSTVEFPPYNMVHIASLSFVKRIIRKTG